ncbi:ABC transporter permease [Clostridium sp. BJN0001]|uniref:ABC transporter permease n=1 Tax=Clostridium sp. BJN0001 TaxID=2930219 RepID=UPI001FD18675|nr:ABC transporter permease [Clostridium sp. BJN0001]
MIKKLHYFLRRFYIFLIILILWKLVSDLGIWSSYILSPPEKVLKTLISMIEDNSLLKNIAISFRRVFTGFFISASFGIPLGIFFGVNIKVYEYFKTLLNFIRNIPPISLIPMLILWCGIGEESKIIIIILASFFPIFLNTLKGIKNCDNNLIEVGKSFKLSYFTIIRRIIIPSAVVDIVVGLRLSLGYSFRAIVGAELIAASSGLGYLISDAKDMSRTDAVIVGILAIGVVGIICDTLFLKLIKMLSKGRQDCFYE